MVRDCSRTIQLLCRLLRKNFYRKADTIRNTFHLDKLGYRGRASSGCTRSGCECTKFFVKALHLDNLLRRYTRRTHLTSCSQASCPSQRTGRNF